MSSNQNEKKQDKPGKPSAPSMPRSQQQMREEQARIQGGADKEIPLKK